MPRDLLDIRDPLTEGNSTATPEISIRRANLGDVEPIHRMIRRAYEHYIPMLGYMPVPMRRNYNEQLVCNPVWLAEHNAEMVGLLELIFEADHVVVENLAIAPSFQGRKLGRWFMDFAEKAARLNGLSLMRTYTNQLMERNVAMYIHLGYRETDRATTEGVPRVFLEKHLDARKPG